MSMKIMLAMKEEREMEKTRWTYSGTKRMEIWIGMGFVLEVQMERYGWCFLVCV